MLTPTAIPFELVLPRPLDTPHGDHPFLVHLFWRTGNLDGRRVQAYVDDELAHAFPDALQHDAWLRIDRTRPGRITLLAVDADMLWQPQSDALPQSQPVLTSQAMLHVLRDETLPVDTQVHWQLGDDDTQQPMWSDADHRSGFGALFGIGDFGFDGITGPGLGEGALGLGPLGVDGQPLTLHHRRPDPGTYASLLSAVNEHNVPLTSTQALDDITVTFAPDAPSNFTSADRTQVAWS